MKKFKDFLYDKNDIFIALLILLAASLIIIWRMNAIIDYPKELVGLIFFVKDITICCMRIFICWYNV